MTLQYDSHPQQIQGNIKIASIHHKFLAGSGSVGRFWKNKRQKINIGLRGCQPRDFISLCFERKVLLMFSLA